MNYERGLRTWITNVDMTHGIEKPPVIAPRVVVGLRKVRKRQKGSSVVASGALGASATGAGALGARSAATRSSHLAWVIL